MNNNGYAPSEEQVTVIYDNALPNMHAYPMPNGQYGEYGMQRLSAVNPYAKACRAYATGLVVRFLAITFGVVLLCVGCVQAVGPVPVTPTVMSFVAMVVSSIFVGLYGYRLQHQRLQVLNATDYMPVVYE